MDSDCLIIAVTFVKIIAFQHPCNRMLSSQFDQPIGAKRVEPTGIETDLGCLRIKYLEYLFLVGERVLDYLIPAKRGARGVLSSGISDHRCEIPNHEKHLVPQLLKMPQLVDQNGVPKMQIWRSRIESRLYPQGAPEFQPFDQLRLDEQLVAPFF